MVIYMTLYVTIYIYIHSPKITSNCMLFLRSPNMNLWYGLKYIFISLSIHIYIYLLYSPYADITIRSPFTKPSAISGDHAFRRQVLRWRSKTTAAPGFSAALGEAMAATLSDFGVIFSMGNPWKGWLKSMVYAIIPYGSKHLLRRYLTPQIMSQTLPKKVLGSIGIDITA